ncbi:MAG: MFS transporter, partial [Chloroflexi bacterium]
MLSLPPLLRQPGFRLFWLGVAFTQIGSRATAAANLWQIQDLTDSIFAVGVVSLVEGVAVIGIAPLGGTIADRMDRKRL